MATEGFYERRVDPLVERVLGWGAALLARIPPRWLAYGMPALSLVLYLIAAELGYGSAPRERAMGYALLFWATATSSRQIRALVDYHPIYAAEKAVEAGGWLILSCQALFNLASSARWITWVWIAVFLVARLVALEFILHRNADPSRVLIKTQRGPVAMLSREQANDLADRLSGEIRHHNIDPEYREQLLADLGFPSPGEMAEDMLRQMHARRERLARERMGS